MSISVTHSPPLLSAAQQVVQKELDADDALLRRALPTIGVLLAVNIIALTWLRVLHWPG